MSLYWGNKKVSLYLGDKRVRLSVGPAGGGLLPDGYTGLEYIESTGTQYIDTGYTFATSTKTRLVFEKTGTNSINQGPKANLCFGANNPSGEILVSYGNVIYLRGNTNTPAYIPELNTKNDVIIDYTPDACALTVNGALYTQRKSHLVNLKPVCIFASPSMAGASDTAVEVFFQHKLYRAQMWNGEQLIRDLIPAIRNSDNVVGVYDMAAGEFLTNAGTGSFIAGGINASTASVMALNEENLEQE